MDELTPDELDAFMEIVNIGMGRAAGVFHDLLATHVDLSVPDLQVVKLSELSSLLQSCGSETRSAVEQSFSGSVDGRAVLVFPKESALQLVSALWEQDVEDEPEFDESYAAAFESPPVSNDFTLIDVDTKNMNPLLEVGNVVLQSVVGTVSNEFRFSLSIELPNYQESSLRELFIGTDLSLAHRGLAVIAQTHFSILELSLTGELLLVFALDSFDCIRESLKKYCEEA